MKRIDIPNYLSALLAGLILTFSSCEKYLAIDPPNDKLATPNAFADSASAALAITGIYSNLMEMNTAFIAWQVRLGALSSDELQLSFTDATYTQVAENNLQPDNTLLSAVWTDIYSHIYQANSAAEGIEASPGIRKSAKEVLIAEAKFIRAFLLFYAAGDWGDVPLTLTTDYRVNALMPRTSMQEVYRQVTDDLQYAAGHLPERDPSGEKVRPNRMAALALLARVNLYGGNWQQAADYSSQVISSGRFLLLPVPAGTFLKESTETIWQLYPATLGNSYDTYDGAVFIPSSMTNSVVPSFIISGELYNSFADGDARKTTWIGTKASAGNARFVYKYKVRSRSSSVASKEYTIVLRLAEQYLIRAEARAHMDNVRDAVGDLNVIRSRAGLSGLPSDLGREAVLAAVELERRHELFCEWGHRWLDLKRTARADAVLGLVKGNNWQPDDQLWPVPADQLLANPALTQNKGY